jgi:hypothetical protein
MNDRTALAFYVWGQRRGRKLMPVFQADAEPEMLRSEHLRSILFC